MPPVPPAPRQPSLPPPQPLTCLSISPSLRPPLCGRNVFPPQSAADLARKQPEAVWNHLAAVVEADLPGPPAGEWEPHLSLRNLSAFMSSGSHGLFPMASAPRPVHTAAVEMSDKGEGTSPQRLSVGEWRARRIDLMRRALPR